MQLLNRFFYFLLFWVWVSFKFSVVEFSFLKRRVAQETFMFCGKLLLTLRAIRVNCMKLNQCITFFLPEKSIEAQQSFLSVKFIWFVLLNEILCTGGIRVRIKYLVQSRISLGFIQKVDQLCGWHDSSFWCANAKWKMEEEKKHTEMNFPYLLMLVVCNLMKDFLEQKITTADDKCSSNIDLHFIKKLLNFRSYGEILVEIEEVFELKLLHRNCIGFSNRKSRHLQCFFNTPSVVFVRCK